jgi:hypothetical protein
MVLRISLLPQFPKFSIFQETVKGGDYRDDQTRDAVQESAFDEVGLQEFHGGMKEKSEEIEPLSVLHPSSGNDVREIVYRLELIGEVTVDFVQDLSSQAPNFSREDDLVVGIPASPPSPSSLEKT